METCNLQRFKWSQVLRPKLRTNAFFLHLNSLKFVHPQVTYTFITGSKHTHSHTQTKEIKNKNLATGAMWSLRNEITLTMQTLLFLYSQAPQIKPCQRWYQMMISGHEIVYLELDLKSTEAPQLLTLHPFLRETYLLPNPFNSKIYLFWFDLVKYTHTTTTTKGTSPLVVQQIKNNA